MARAIRHALLENRHRMPPRLAVDGINEAAEASDGERSSVRDAGQRGVSVSENGVRGKDVLLLQPGV